MHSTSENLPRTRLTIAAMTTALVVSTQISAQTETKPDPKSTPTSAPAGAPASSTPQDAPKAPSTPAGAQSPAAPKPPETKPDAPKSEAPKSDAPKSDAPKSDAPKSAQKPATVPTKDDILEATPRTDLPRERIVLLGEQFDAELCFDEASRATGMGGRSEFPAGTAMIFVHPRAIMLNYWMKDCLIDMDMIFVDSRGRITAIHEATREKLRSTGETKTRYENRLYLYSSRSPAQFVIELPAGSLKRLKPMVGQQLGLDWARYAQRAK
jgi:uncharacterized membrane protein (UPF0127 family)